MRAPGRGFCLDGTGNGGQRPFQVALLRMQPGKVGVGNGKVGVGLCRTMQVVCRQGGVATRQRMGAQVIQGGGMGRVQVDDALPAEYSHVMLAATHQVAGLCHQACNGVLK